MTESTTPLSSPKTSESAPKISSNKSTTKKTVQKKASSQQLSSNASVNKVSKLAVFALLLAVAAPAGHYYWQQLQDQKLSQNLTQKINAENDAALTRYQQQVQQALIKQQQNFDQELQQVIATIKSTSQAKIAELDANVAQLKQNINQRQSSDWLLHEAEYLIRIAARTLWLEHDTHAAIGLLNDANKRLAELNDPTFLSVREVILQDIKSLELMPTLQTDEVVLTLMAMNKQVAQLPLAIVDLGSENSKENDLTLSNDISDWQHNLAKTWQKFFNDFIRIRSRTGNVEPLISPKQQSNLKQNLSLKIQLALWAATERKGDIYQKSLTEIQQWLNEFFDMNASSNQQFIKTLQDLQQKQIAYNYSNELSALKAIRVKMANTKGSSAIEPKQTTDKSKQSSPDKKSEAEQAPTKQKNQEKSEGKA